MADNYTQFSTVVTSLSTKELNWFKGAVKDTSEMSALQIKRWSKACGFGNEVLDTDSWPDFEVDFEGGNMYLFASDHGSPDNVATVLQAFLRKFRPTEVLSFQWAHTCSKPRPDEFGGGAVVITATGTQWMNTGEWIYNKTKEIEDEQKRASGEEQPRA